MTGISVCNYLFVFYSNLLSFKGFNDNPVFSVNFWGFWYICHIFKTTKKDILWTYITVKLFIMFSVPIADNFKCQFTCGGFFVYSLNDPFLGYSQRLILIYCVKLNANKYYIHFEPAAEFGGEVERWWFTKLF